METNGHEVPEKAGASYDRQLGAEGSGAGRGKRWTGLLGGAVGGTHRDRSDECRDGTALPAVTRRWFTSPESS